MKISTSIDNSKAKPPAGTRAKSHKDAGKEFGNHEVVVIAAYRLGARIERVDTEDVAVESNRIAPGRFAWRKYTDQINIDNVRWALLDAKKAENGALLTGSAKVGWLLTNAGTRFAEKAIELLNSQGTPRNRITTRERIWRGRERERLLSEVAYEKFATGNADAITSREAARFFRVDEYVVGQKRRDSIERLINAFQNDRELGTVVAAIANKVQKG